VVAVLAGLAVAWRLGAFERLSEPRQLARELAGTGAWGWVGFVVAYALLQPFGVPGTVFVVAAPLIWPWPVAFALSLTGTMAASVIGFAFARFVGRDFVAARIPERFRKYDEALAKNAFRTVFVLRFVFWMPQVLHVFLGVSKVPFWTHFWASLLGYLVPLFLVSFLGAELFDASGAMQPKAFWVMGALLVVSGVMIAVLRRLERTPPPAASE
jgi:uncharacterized membrane protein YdjX (TVP38/TMEM64 family)